MRASTGQSDPTKCEGSIVYAAIRQYELGAGSVPEFTQIIEAGFVDRLSELPGFVGYQLLATGSDEIVSITLFHDEETAVRSNELAADFVRERLQQFQLNLTSSLNGEVRVQRGFTVEQATAEPA